jgi:predicted nucleic acid-binding protein
MYLIDTNVLSELRRRDRTNRTVASWADKVDPLDLFLSAITILEIEAGALLIQRRDKAQGAVLRAWIDSKVLPAFAGRILAVDTAVALRCARLHVPDPQAERDALIAATALVHRLTMVTRNVADFQAMGVDLLNPWE